MTEINAELVVYRLDTMAKDITEIKADIRAMRDETQAAYHTASVSGSGNKVAAAAVGGAVSAIVIGVTTLIEYIRNI